MTVDQSFVVMAKPVGSHCNLNCSYCYYLGTDALIGSAPAPRMDDATLEALIRRYIADSPGPMVQFTWHGGEPTLAGLDFYQKAVELQKKYLPAGWECWNNLQTNGVLLDDDWCAFLSREHFDVGLSLDGTAALHDRYRRDAAGQGTYERVHAAVQRLKAHGVKPDLLCTVTADAAREPLAVYQPLRDLGTGWMQFIPIVRWGYNGAPTEDSVSPEGYGDFLCTVFDLWSRNDIGKTGIQFFNECALVKAGGQASLCWMAPVCGRVPVVERDGGVYSCDHAVDLDHRLGTLDDGLRGLIDSSVQAAFGSLKRDSLTGQCQACPHLPMCNGGCPRDRFGVSDDGEPGQYYLCDGLRRFFRYAGSRLDILAAGLRVRQSPDDLMAALRAEERAMWKNIGRNDPCPCGSGKKAKTCCLGRKP